MVARSGSATLPRAIVDLEEFTESINLLIYGDTGVGKTELVGYLPGRVLILSSENGTIVIKRMMKRLGISAKEAKRFKVWPIRSWKDLEDAYIWVRDHGTKVFDWVAIDSATSVQQRAMRAAMEKAVAHNPVKRDIDLPDRGEHQKMQNAMKRMVGDFNELPINTLWLAQAMRREDRDGNEIVLPFIMGKDYEVSSWVCAQMQAFAYYAKRPAKVEVTVGKRKKVKTVTERVLIWDSFADSEDVTYWAKDRYQVMPSFTVMATGEKQVTTFDDLINAILGSGAENLQRASELRDEDARNARAWRGETEPEDDEDSDSDDDTEDTEQEDSEDSDDSADDDDNDDDGGDSADAQEGDAAEEDEPEESPRARKAAAKRGAAKAPAKKATKSARAKRFRATTEEDED